MISVVENLPRRAEVIAEVEEAERRGTAYFELLSAQAKRRAGFQSISLESSILAGHPGRAIVDFTNRRGFGLVGTWRERSFHRSRAVGWDVAESGPFSLLQRAAHKIGVTTGPY
jgi:hypothetical protein